jgi:hypothetical protein
MTTEQPTRPARPPRPGPAFRRAALGLAPDPTAVGDGPVHVVAPRRESLREALARIPDIDRDEVAIEGVDGAAASEPIDVAAAVDAADGVVTDGDGDGDGDGEPTAGGLRSFASRLLNGALPEDFEVEEVSERDGNSLVITAEPEPCGQGEAPIESVAGLDAAEAVGLVAAPAMVSELASDAPDWLVAAAVEEAEARSRREAKHHTYRRSVPTWRRVLFGLTVGVLVISVPILGFIGLRLVSESTDGEFSTSIKKRTDPGYEEEVISTPTQLVLHSDASGRPVAATFLALSGANGGGSVIYVPLQTEARSPGYGVDRLIGAYDALADDPAAARQLVAGLVGSLLNVGIDGVVEVDDRGWAQLVGPVAPLSIVNPDPIELEGGTIESGPVELSAEQVGPYLAAEIPGETAFNRSLRHEAVWAAWLEAIAESDRDDVVPGERSAGLGLFARELAAGPVEFSAVPVDADPDQADILRVDDNALADLMLAAVPMPDSPAPGARPTVRLLNGVSADPIPAEVLQKVVQVGGAITVVGNGPSFDRDVTTIVYANPELRGYAELLAAGLGGGKPRHDPEAEDSVGLTVILGRDVIETASATTTRPRGVTTTTSSNGDSDESDDSSESGAN